MTDKGLNRRDLLKKAGLGGAVLLGGSVIGSAARRANGGTDEEGRYSVHHSESVGPGGATLVGDQVLEAVYGHSGVPIGIDATALDQVTNPPQPQGLSGGQTRDVEIDVTEKLIEVSDGVFQEAWTYNGSVPGPTIRATEGDVVRVHLRNRTGNAHNIHFHGAHLPEEDGWEPVPAGGEMTYSIDAGPAGVHPYHCHTAPLAEHVSRGLYGTMIVDPVGGRPPAHEVNLVISGFSNDTVGRNGVVAWNGIAGFYHVYPIKVERGVPVRAYVTNMLEYEPVASFHLHAQTFDVYPAGMGETPAFREDTITLGMGQRAMIEFTLPSYGRYMFHPHQHWLADKGAMGWFAAI